MREIAVLDKVHNQIVSCEDYTALFIRKSYKAAGREYDLGFHTHRLSLPEDYKHYTDSPFFIQNRLGVIPVVPLAKVTEQGAIKPGYAAYKLIRPVYSGSHRFINTYAISDNSPRISESSEGEREVEGRFLDFFLLGHLGYGESIAHYDSYIRVTDEELRNCTENIADFLNLDALRRDIDLKFVH